MQTLASIPFFKDATDIDLKNFDRRCTWRKLEEEQVVVDFEDKSSDVYFLISGDVRILVRTQGGKEVILTDMHAGSYFGELSAIDGTPRSANVTALTRCEMCIISGSVFREIIFSSKVLAEKLLRLLTQRVRDLNGRLIENTVLDVRHRLYSELLRQSQPRSGNPIERIVSPPPFHHVLAGRVGCRREQITRELTNMVGDGLAEKTRGGLVLKNPTVLRERIQSALKEAG
ncbi:MAG TPA: Crp/Fnr family transcriptional regulator [Beijerinckiaceae bacterium]|nr:Crp/Fnr family transcriptional regulator [Beijerinckiaceae bacterium]